MIQIATPQTRRKARIEIIPLIDIIFFLLATFVLVSMSMVKNQGVRIRLPVAATGQALERAQVLLVRVNKDGTVVVDKQPATLDALQSRLSAFQKSEADPKVIIQGDTDAAYGQVVGVLDRVRQAGISKVAVQTTKKGS